MTRYPPPPGGTSLPSLLYTAASMVGKGLVAEPGFRVVMPGRGVIRIMPVSVCHQVSTTGARLPPMCSRYQIHASGLMGSPTVPSRRSELRSYLAAYSGPHFMCVLIVVGAVYRMSGLYRSTIFHHRSLSGKSGVPS